MTRICDYDEAFTRQEMYEETGHCLKCKANPKCPMHIKAIEEEYGVKVRTDGRRRKMTDAEKAYQYFVIAVPENEEQAKAYFWARKALQSTHTQPNEHLTCDGCISLGTSYGPCMNCIRSRLRGDMYRRPPEGEEET